MVLTDTHTHLYVEQFSSDREAVIRRALANGVKKFFLPAIDSSYTGEMIRLQKAFPDHVFLMTGLHPTAVKRDNKKELAHVKSTLSKIPVCAIGEIGIDLYWDSTFLEQQKEVFRQQIRLAGEHELPIVIHCRESFAEIFSVLNEERQHLTTGIFHCFTGNLEQARQAISLNMKLGIGGVVTYKNSGLDGVLKEIPLEHIVLETDSPYLAPVPYRGKRNESAYLLEIAGKVAEIYGLTVEEVAEQTTANAKSVFRI